ncbi:hypothetical protein BN7_157 [Wickerhamomyces ciferrii]|uniref:Uncharacterized protein n=1 Tax=Wickerhamomyces ciferrii (strain ATCC 14091 / BCRC 22168 / CBS 111 / JCM 3599 / NBRC 0793 / NRRL Y-1031 F-60-10) TaxID=1206466 RepID=K0KHH5_WICCF|nr:uncharacterized protein BN7_157 [Wickerhamomyces ciferrii]CCH40623.1 hypothetical protein BN7_157 [Wickerhamomyces ciferrii]
MMETVHQSLVNQLSEITINKPTDIKLQPQNGEIMVKKGSGRTKIRKGQTDAEYGSQKQQFHMEGPMLNTKTWLEELDVSKIDPNIKSDRAKLESLTERLYFKRDYVKCLETTKFALELFKDLNHKKIKNEIDELEYLKSSCSKKIETVQ